MNRESNADCLNAEKTHMTQAGKNLNLALVHDDLMQTGGAERVVMAFHDLYPNVPLFTALYSPHDTFAAFAEMDVRTSYLQRTPFALRRLHKLALPLFPVAFEQFDFSGYDMVLSSTSRFAKGVITGPETCHVCYCHTPPRFAWRPHNYLDRSLAARLLVPLVRGQMRDLRIWDFQSAQRVDYFIANSHNVARRIRKYYRRGVAAVIPPPVETKRFGLVPSKEIGTHFLIVSRLVGYKRVDLAIEACNQLQLPLRIVGNGPAMSALRRMAGPTVRFLGQLSDQEVAAEMARCRALIFPGEEDFGLTPLECMASGRPVVAYRAGGALETVIDGMTGMMFDHQTPECLGTALNLMGTASFAPEYLQTHARAFDRTVFAERVQRFMEAAWVDHQHTNAQAFMPKGGSQIVPDILYDRTQGFQFTKK